MNWVFILREILLLLAWDSLMISFFICTVSGSIVFTSSNYDVHESNGSVSVCAAVNVTALERRIVVQLSSQDSSAQSTLTKCNRFHVAEQHVNIVF